MISSGNATVHVSNLEAAIRFYTEQLGLRLTNRFGDRWATVEAGPSYWTSEETMAGLVLGLRPASAHYPAPGTRSGVGFGLESYRPIDTIANEFTKRGVRVTSEVISFEAGNTFSFADLDGVPSFMHEFPPEMVDEAGRDAVPDSLVTGGIAIVYVSNMDDAIRFYTETLGLRLTNRFEHHFATVEVGRTLVLGIHPRTPRTPIPGEQGSVTLGLVVDEPIDMVVSRLTQRGVRLNGRSDPGRSVDIEDLDGNVITLWDAHAYATHDDLMAPAVPGRR